MKMVLGKDDRYHVQFLAADNPKGHDEEKGKDEQNELVVSNSTILSSKTIIFSKTLMAHNPQFNT